MLCFLMKMPQKEILCFLFSAEIADFGGNFPKFFFGQGIQMFQLIHEQHKAFVIANLIELNEIIHHDPGTNATTKMP